MHYFTANEWIYIIFENGSKNLSFLIKDDEVWDKYDKIWDVIKVKLGTKLKINQVLNFIVNRFININI